MWRGYSAYSPAALHRYLEIYRTYYNYCLTAGGWLDGPTALVHIQFDEAV
jgi:hypothetical protein